MVFAPYKKEKAFKPGQPKNLVPNGGYFAPPGGRAPTATRTPQPPMAHSPQARPQQPVPSVMRGDRFAGGLFPLGLCTHGMSDEYFNPYALKLMEAASSPMLPLQVNGQLPQVNAQLSENGPTLRQNIGLAQNIYSELKSMPRYTGRAFRAVFLHPSERQQFVKGRRIRFRTFVSTTQEIRLLSEFRPTNNGVLMLKLNEDAVAAAVDYASAYPQEREVLVAPYTEFEVEEVNDRDGLVLITLNAVQSSYASGLHMLLRAENLDAPEVNAVYEKILQMQRNSAVPNLIRGPIPFEQSNITAAALVSHAEDDNEWKVVLAGSPQAATDFLERLREARVHVPISVLLYLPDPNDCAAAAGMLRHPMVVKITSDTNDVLDFARAPTLYTPQLE